MKQGLQIAGLIAVALTGSLLTNSQVVAQPITPAQMVKASGGSSDNIQLSFLGQLTGRVSSGSIGGITEQFTPPDNGGPSSSQPTGTR